MLPGNITEIIQAGGLILIGLIVFAESGLLIGFFLPGDTLLFSAGLLAAQGTWPLWQLLTVIVLAAIIGDNVGYSIGRAAGKRLFQKEDGLFFRKAHVKRAHAFYLKHGGKTIILARFVPIVRTFAPVVAGIGAMSRARFAAFNVVGAFIWGIGVTLLGYWFGNQIPHLDRYITPVILAVVVFSIAPAIIHLWRDPKFKQKLKIRIKSRFNK